MSAPASLFQTTPAAAPKTLPPADITQTLGVLLNRYVALLEGSWRSGWSVDEEEAVRVVCAQLARVKGRMFCRRKHASLYGCASIRTGHHVRKQ
jgi:hypothetical protein